MIPERYTIENIIGSIKNPERLFEEVKRVAAGVAFIPHRIETKPMRISGYGTNIMDEDWDNLIILDACRYDTFIKNNNIDNYESLTSIKSVGSHSAEFIEKTFSQKQFLDTVYVTANGYGASLSPDTFHDLIFTNVDESNKSSHPYWEGFAPDTVARAAIDAKRNYPNKRLITHFMQPHAPYLGDKAEDLRQELEKDGVLITQNKQKYQKDGLNESYRVYSTLMNAARDGLISQADMETIYQENLEVVLEYVKILLDELEGKTVITADHGELLCEDIGVAKYASLKRITNSGRFLGHAPNIYVDGLRQVPWMTIQDGSRPDIVAEESKNTDSTPDDEVEERLEMLGYKG